METTPPTDRKKSCLIKGLVVVAIVALVLGGLWWWHNRPIRPVELSAEENVVVAEKVEAIQNPAEPVYEKGGLLGVCFLREAPERANGSGRRAGKWGLVAPAHPVVVLPALLFHLR